MSVLCFSEYKSSYCLQAQNLLFKRTKFDCGKFIVLLLKAMSMQSSTAIGCAVIMTVVLLVHAAPIVDEQEEYLSLWADLEQARADQYRPSEPPRGEQEEYTFIPVLSPSFLYHPYIPSFISKDFSFTCLLSFFFAAHCILALRNILPGAIYCCFTHLLCLCHVVGSVLCMYANFHC